MNRLATHSSPPRAFFDLSRPFQWLVGVKPPEIMPKTKIAILIATIVFAMTVVAFIARPSDTYNGYRLKILPPSTNGAGLIVAIDNDGGLYRLATKGRTMFTPRGTYDPDSALPWPAMDKLRGEAPEPKGSTEIPADYKAPDMKLVPDTIFISYLEPTNFWSLCRFAGRFILARRTEPDGLYVLGSGIKLVRLECPTTRCDVEAINASGDVLGWSQSRGRPMNAVIWHQFKPHYLLDLTLSPPQRVENGFGLIGNSGGIAMTMWSARKPSVLMVGNMAGLASIPNPQIAGYDYMPQAINNHDELVGIAVKVGSNPSSRRPFVCRNNHIDFISPPGVEADAMAINDRGVIAGTIYTHENLPVMQRVSNFIHHVKPVYNWTPRPCEWTPVGQRRD